MYKESPDFKDNISDLWYSFDKMNEHIKRYIEEYDLRLCIAMNSKMGQSYKPVGVINEEEYFLIYSEIIIILKWLIITIKIYLLISR